MRAIDPLPDVSDLLDDIESPCSLTVRSIPVLTKVLTAANDASTLIEVRKLSAAVCKSKTVALRHPVMPVGNRFGG
jgi:hypothetical protein